MPTPGEGRADAETGRERPLRPVRGRAAAATCSRCIAATGSSSTSTSPATALDVPGVRPRHRRREAPVPRTWPSQCGVTFNTWRSRSRSSCRATGRCCSCNSGSRVYCFDLRREGEGTVAEEPARRRTPRVNPQGYTTQVGPDGDIIVRYADGLLRHARQGDRPAAGLRLRCSPATVWRSWSRSTARVLWTRRGMPERTQIYGDARYIVLVEIEANRRPVAAQVAPGAWTGCRSRGARDSGRVLANGEVVPDHSDGTALSDRGHRRPAARPAAVRPGHRQGRVAEGVRLQGDPDQVASTASGPGS